jgi:hypothetical protein
MEWNFNKAVYPHPHSSQSCMDGIEQSGAGKRLFEESDAAL